MSAVRRAPSPLYLRSLSCPWMLSAVKQALRFPTLKIFSGPLLPSFWLHPLLNLLFLRHLQNAPFSATPLEQHQCSISSNVRLIPQILTAPLAALNVGEWLFVFLWVTCHVHYLGTEVNTVYASLSHSVPWENIPFGPCLQPVLPLGLTLVWGPGLQVRPWLSHFFSFFILPHLLL